MMHPRTEQNMYAYSKHQIPFSGGVIRVTFPHKDLKYFYGHHLRLAPRFRPLG